MTNDEKIDITRLKPYDRLICEILINARRPLTTNEVAYYGNMSWLTAKKHLKKLFQINKGITHNKKGRTDFWSLKKLIYDSD